MVGEKSLLRSKPLNEQNGLFSTVIERIVRATMIRHLSCGGALAQTQPATTAFAAS